MLDTDDLPDRLDPLAAGSDSGLEGDDAPPVRSLTDDIESLIDDGRNYAEAEFAFQKTRLAYVADRGKSGALFIFAALAFLHLALIGLVVGTMICLIPLIGPFFAMLVVVGVLILGVITCLFLAKDRFTNMASVFGGDGS